MACGLVGPFENVVETLNTLKEKNPFRDLTGMGFKIENKTNLIPYL